MKKKVVWLPYDMDTALGINNEGELVFDYNLEDSDHQPSGEDIFNGQNSVIWNNIRDAFPELIESMYQTLRSNSTDTTGLSYSAVEKMFEEHQSVWSEAIFNEDAWFKYILPFVEEGANYLGMLLGSKAEQRKWWLYNRFRYMDSKYNAGDALTDYITIRPYAAANISITPYADIYATVKWDATITSERASRGNTVTLICPYSSMNDNVVTIYSAVQLASIGDLSQLKPGLVNIEKAINLQQLKIGDSSNSYNNVNLRSLTLGNNKLLKILDARNSSGLGDTTLEGHTQSVVDISGCTGIEEVYFEGTKVTGVTLPNGGVLRILHLPSTITNLTIRNQPNITDLIVNVSHVTTLRIENCPTVNARSLLNTLPTNARVRLVGVEWEAVDSTEIEALLDLLDTMRGLDINGNNLEDAYVEGTLHTTALTGEQIASYKARYPYLKVTADSVVSHLTLKSWDGSNIIDTIECRNGVPQETIPTGPSRTATAQYTYSFVGWNTYQDAQVNDPDATTNVIEDRIVYAAYSRTVRTYTVTWVNNGTTVKTETKEYGSTASWTGAMPTDGDGNSATGWEPTPGIITGNTTYTASYDPLTGAYGVEWDYYNSSPVLTRRGLAASFTNPVPATSVSGTGSSPFDNIMPWAGMKKYNIIDNAIAYSQDDPEFSETDYDVVVYIPQFYYKAEKNTTTQKWTWAISPTAKNGYELHPGSGRYIGKYLISGDTSSAIYSKAGAIPLADKTLAQYNSGASLKGQDWKAIDIQTWSAIQLLYLVEFANFNSQAMLVDMSQSATLVNTGTTANAVYHTIKGGRTNNQYRWIENLFSQLWTLVDKYNISTAGQIAIYIGSSGAYTGHFIPNTSQASKYITDFGYSNSCKWVFVPSEVTDDSDNNKFVCDTVTTVYGSGTRYPIVGGHYGVEYKNGIFYLHFTNAFDRHSQYIGSRLIFTGN